jgi:protein-S-isoprenylcysteine O-methyltransferase Ste14
MKQFAAFIYGIICYLIFFGTFLYAIGFVGNIFVPLSVDRGNSPIATATALVVNLILLSIFALQHSIMARPGFKKWWTRIIPKSIERSTYVLLASVALLLIFWQWRPMPDVVWSVENKIGNFVLWALFGLGWGLVLVSTFLINHFDLFGLRQVYSGLRGVEYGGLEFKTPFLYKLVRHPIMLGFIIAFWSTPVMTVGHLLFAAVTTAYILVAIRFEERDLSNLYPEKYGEYRKRVSMIVPIPKIR